MRKVYKVIGESEVKPLNLPEGLTIKEETLPGVVDVTVTSKFGAKFRIQDYTFGLGSPDVMTLDIDPTPGNQSGLYSKIFDRENATKMRDALTQILGGRLLKVIHDAGDSLNDPGRWYECDNGKYVYRAATPPSAGALGSETYEYIKNTYGIRTETLR